MSCPNKLHKDVISILETPIEIEKKASKVIYNVLKFLELNQLLKVKTADDTDLCIQDITRENK